MFLQFRFNYKKIQIHTGSFEKLPVLDKSGEAHLVKFLGFINADEAQSCRDAISCKIGNIEAFKSNFDDPYTFISPINSLIQGCIINQGVYVLLEDNKPRVINTKIDNGMAC